MSLPGAWLLHQAVFPDARGHFREIARLPSLLGAGRGFDSRQAAQSTSRTGVLRGLHYVATPPGQAQFVTCLAGRVWDVVVDLRVGSPTFGQHEAVVLDGRSGAGILMPEGIGHGYYVLEGDAVILYLQNQAYAPQHERGIKPLDPDLAVPWPLTGDPIYGARDLHSPTLAEALGQNDLPNYADCLASGFTFEDRP